MKQLLVALLFLCVGSVGATTTKEPKVLEYTDGNIVIQLYDTACVNKEILSMGYPQQLIDQSHAAKITLKGEQLEACWLANDGVVDMVTSEGETGSVPMFVFQVVDPV